MEPYTTPEFREFKNNFDLRTRADWNRKLRISERRDGVISDISKLLSSFGDSQCLKCFKLLSDMRKSPLGEAQSRCEKAIEEMYRFPCGKTVDEAEKAFAEMQKRTLEFVDQFGVREESMVILRPKIEAGQAELDAMRNRITALKEAESLFVKLQVSMGAMEVCATPKLIETARQICREWQEADERLRNMGCILGCNSEPLRDIVAKYSEKIEYYDTQRCRNISDACIEALSEKYSNDAFRAALDAQEQYKQALSRCPMVPVELASEFAELQKHFSDNQRIIFEKKDFHEREVASEELELSRKQALAVRQQQVESNRQNKAEQKRREAKASRPPKEEICYEVAFLHTPGILNPLEYLENHFQYIEEWNTWCDTAIKTGAPRQGLR